jgi:hypothetical protein
VKKLVTVLRFVIAYACSVAAFWFAMAGLWLPAVLAGGFAVGLLVTMGRRFARAIEASGAGARAAGSVGVTFGAALVLVFVAGGVVGLLLLGWRAL